ncbi:unnamed protein product [Diatraea saccharalis]|uniref:Uncharacterized protein n=1 Tax=Diatraea saccharalis TaxID=40085 RepID=A0A9N9R156_9NEOP|nr:unnamed protein product [Diatraea saccharalis]
MPRKSRSASQISEEEKIRRRREQKKLSIRRVRARMTQTDLEERRRKDRERYQKKKEQGLLKTIADFTPREQRQIRKQWREKGKKRREKQRQHDALHNFIETNTPPSTSTLSRASGGSYISQRNRYLLRDENIYLKKKICELESKLAKYRMRCFREIQSAHFGGSKPQISLHTSVYYSTHSEPPNNFLQSTSFCTVSENLRHDPVLICVHLKALIAKIKELSPYLKHLHILSDGPSTQYRNKSMFNLVATYLSKEFGVDTITWHFSERGHGKGAPDGVGGCIKRLCDIHVARGNDISNLEGLMSCLFANCKGIEVYRINELLIPDVEEILNKSVIRPFKGTRDIHQLTWSYIEPRVIHVRRLSCQICATHVKCPHYGLGIIDVNYKPMDNYKLPSEPEGLNTPDTPEAPNTPEEPLNTPENSTVSMSPGFSDRLTPEVTTDAIQQNVRPTKRLRPRLDLLEDSDSSLEVFPKRKRFSVAMWQDSDDDSIF